MPITSSVADIELIDGSTVLPLMLVRARKSDGSEADEPITIQEALVASGAGAPLSEWLEPHIIEDWSSGIGLAYDVALGCDTFSAPGYVFPGGAGVDVTLPATNTSGTQLVAFADYGGDLFVAQRGNGTANTGRVMRSVGGTAAFADSLLLGAGEYLKDLLCAANGAGAYRLFASSSNVTDGSGRLHAWDGAAWTSTAALAFGTNGRNRMVRVYWEGEDGVGDWRVVTYADSNGHISYTRPGGDPMTPADWIEGVKVGGGEAMDLLAVARRHVYLVSPENTYDLDELGNSPALTSYTPHHRGNGRACIYFDGFVYRSLGTGLDRIRVDQGPILQERPGLCSPGWATKAESEWLTGYATAFATYLGGLLVATFSAPLSSAGIFWGVPREINGVETPNPMVWHGPYAVSQPGVDVTKMHVTSTDNTPSSTRLWVAVFPNTQVDPPTLSWISLPSPSGAMADIRGGGGHTFATGAGSGMWNRTCQLWGLANTFKDKGSVKEIYQHTVGSRGLGTPAGTKLTIYSRSDPAPASVAWGTGRDITVGPTEDSTPAVTRGNKIETRIDLFSPGGTASPPKPAILDSLRTTVWRTAPDLDTWTFDVIYGDGVYGLSNGHWPSQSRDVTWTTNALIAMCRAGRLTMRDRQGQRWSVKLKHVLEREASHHDGIYGKTMRARITVAVLGAA